MNKKIMGERVWAALTVSLISANGALHIYQVYQDGLAPTNGL